MEDLHCGYCGEDSDVDESEERTSQEWRCPACGSWNDRTDTGSAANVPLP